MSVPSLHLQIAVAVTSAISLPPDTGSIPLCPKPLSVRSESHVGKTRSGRFGCLLPLFSSGRPGVGRSARDSIRPARCGSSLQLSDDVDCRAPSGGRRRARLFGYPQAAHDLSSILVRLALGTGVRGSRLNITNGSSSQCQENRRAEWRVLHLAVGRGYACSRCASMSLLLRSVPVPLRRGS